MRPHQAYLVGGFLGVAILAVGAGLRVLPVAASSAPIQAASIHAGTAAPNLNRARKGDRLPDAAAPVGQAQPLKAKPQQPRLPEGCEASVSSISHSPLAQTPADCLS